MVRLAFDKGTYTGYISEEYTADFCSETVLFMY